MRIGLFVDGIPVYSIYDRQTDFSQFSTFDISEISVSKGYTSPLYGMNTLGGAINLVTSKPKDKLEIRARYNFISNNENQLAASVGSNMGKYYYQVSYAFSERDSFNLSARFTPTQFQPNKEAFNSHYKNHTLKAKIGFTPNQNHEYSLNFIFQKGSKGGLIDATTGGRYWDWPNYDKYTLYLLGNSAFSENLWLNTKIYWDHFYNNLTARGNLPVGSSSRRGFRGISIYADHSLGVIETLSYAIDENKKLDIGLNLRYNYTYNPNYTLQNVYTNTDSYQDFTSSEFVQYAQRLSDTFRFVLSGSYDRVDTIKAIKASAPTGYTTDVWGFNLQGIVFAAWNAYNTTHINIGKKSNLPSLKDRYGTPWGERIANPDLKPESAINYEIGHSFDYDATHLSAVAFFNHLSNMFVTKEGYAGCTSPSSNNGRGCTKLENVDQGYSYGVELALSQGLFDDKLTLLANYTYTDQYVDYESNGRGDREHYNRILYYPKHIANAQIIFTPHTIPRLHR